MMGLDLAKAGLIVAFGAFIGEGSQMFFGSLSDKGYRKGILIIGLAISMASAFLAYTSSLPALFALYLTTCIGSGCFHPCAASLVTELVPERRGLFMTIFATGGSLGLATSQLTFSHIHAWFDGQTYVMALPALALALFLLFYRFPQANDEMQQKKVQNKASLKDFVRFLKDPSLRALYFSQVANQSILWGTIFILPDALKMMGHGDLICYGGGHFCFILGAAFLMIPSGYLADLISPRQIMLYGGLISCAAFYFILFFGGISVAFLIPALFVLGATLAIMNPLAVSLGVQLEPNRTGSVSAFLMGLVWCISEALGAGGVGAMSSFFEDGGPVKALALLGSLFLVQIYGVMRLPKTLKCVI
jgi:FSR family fosmidomycin resistance protein-like MFS transporter